MKNPLVSVIVPVYNGEAFIQETLNAVIQQEFKDWEVIVIDDGSTDKVQDLVKKILQKDSRIIYFYQPNQGVSVARNLGIQKSNGKYLAFLDADDVWLPNNLLVKVKYLENSEWGLVHSDAEVINEKSALTSVFMKGNEGDLLNALLAWKETQIPGPSSILVRRTVVDLVGGFDKRLSTAADQDFFIRVAKEFKIARIPQVTWRYRIHDANMHKDISRMEKDVIIVFGKARDNNFFYSYWFQRKCFANMYLILAASWAGDGKNFYKAFWFATRAFLTNPFIIIRMIKKLLQKWKA